MVERNPPETGKENPHMIRAMYEAMEHSAMPSHTLFDRLASLGNVYHIGRVFTITPSQGSAYFVIDNSDGSNPFQLQSDQIKVSGGDAMVYIRDEPDIDMSTFTQQEFVNVRSDVIPGPDADSYFGYDSDVTISDTGRVFDKDFIKASSGSPGQTSTGVGSNGKVRYIIGDDSMAMLEIMNDSSNEIEVSISAAFYYLPDVPSIVSNPNSDI